MSVKNIFYAQSGGVTAVINSTASGVIKTASQYDSIGKVYAGHNGILGAINEDLIDTSLEPLEVIDALRYTPSGAFGSCRYKLKDPSIDTSEYEQIINVFKAHNIGYFLYNGGGDSQDTTHKLFEYSKSVGYPLVCIGLPKTVDNDLALTDNCPGFGSVAKYVGVSIREASLDVAAMSQSSTKVFVMEVMGRHSGWITASAGLAGEKEGDSPHILLFPEKIFNPQEFLAKVKHCVESYGFCTVVVSEGIRNEAGTFISAEGAVDAFGHAQLGGTAPKIAHLIRDQLGYKNHWAVCDYLQRSAAHIASQTDAEQAFALGKASIEYALAGKSGVMLTIERVSNSPYQWIIGDAPLGDIANIEKILPDNYITEDGFGITEECREYMQPLIIGEAYPPYKNGLPDYTHLTNHKVEKN